MFEDTEIEIMDVIIAGVIIIIVALSFYAGFKYLDYRETTDFYPLCRNNIEELYYNPCDNYDDCLHDCAKRLRMQEEKKR